MRKSYYFNTTEDYEYSTPLRHFSSLMAPSLSPSSLTPCELQESWWQLQLVTAPPSAAANQLADAGSANSGRASNTTDLATASFKLARLHALVSYRDSSACNRSAHDQCQGAVWLVQGRGIVRCRHRYVEPKRLEECADPVDAVKTNEMLHWWNVDHTSLIKEDNASQTKW
jgi:hypothetical protein